MHLLKSQALPLCLGLLHFLLVHTAEEPAHPEQKHPSTASSSKREETRKKKWMWQTSADLKKPWCTLYHTEIVLSQACEEVTLVKLLVSEINIFLHSGFFKSWKYHTSTNSFCIGKEEVQRRVPILGQNQTFALIAWKPESVTWPD